MIKTKMKRGQKLELLLGKIGEIHKKLSKNIEDTTVIDIKLDKFKRFVLSIALQSDKSALDRIVLKSDYNSFHLDLENTKLLNVLLEEYLVNNNYGDNCLECQIECKSVYDTDLVGMLYSIFKEIDLARIHKIPNANIKDTFDLLTKYYI